MKIFSFKKNVKISPYHPALSSENIFDFADCKK